MGEGGKEEGGLVRFQNPSPSMEPLHSITHAHGLKALFYVLFCHALSVDHIAQSSETCYQCAFKTRLLVFLSQASCLSIILSCRKGHPAL